MSIHGRLRFPSGYPGMVLCKRLTNIINAGYNLNKYIKVISALISNNHESIQGILVFILCCNCDNQFNLRIKLIFYKLMLCNNYG